MTRSIHRPDRDALRRRIDRSRAAAIASVHVLDRLDDPATTPAQRRVVHASRAMADILAWVRLAAKTLRNALVIGEPGTGKSLLAEIIHAEAGGGPFQVIDCRSEDFPLPDPRTLRGTLVLDAIDRASPALQAHLLRILLTATHAAARPRIISLAQRPLDPLVAGGRFRGDLHARLQGHQLVVPPLRERPSDIPALATAFHGGLCRELGIDRPALPAQELTELTARPWPGNVRELEEVLRARLVAPPRDPDVVFGPMLPSIRCCIDALVDEALRRCGGRQGAAARMIGITPQSLSERLQRRRQREDSCLPAVRSGDDG